MKNSSSEQKQKQEGGVLTKAVLSLFVVLLVGGGLFSCKSAPQEEKPAPSKPSVKINVNAFDTLEHDSLVYIRIPVKEHSALTNNMLKKFVGGDVPEKYISNITENIDFIYVGAGSPSDKGRLQIACDGKLSNLAKMGLSFAEGWSRESRKMSAGNYNVYTESNSHIELCLPGSDLILISQNIEPQLSYFDGEAQRQIRGEDAKPDSEWEKSEIYNFVGATTTKNVHVYMKNPISFVTQLLGVSLSSSIFKLNFIECDLKLLPSGKYSIDIDMEFSREGFVSRAEKFLNVAFLLTDASVYVIDETHLHVTGIQVSIEQLQKILGAYF